MHQLTPDQAALVTALAQQLGAIPGVQAVVLGGSHARGRARPDSDIDLGLLYSEDTPFSIAQVRSWAAGVNDTPEPVVTGFYEWGRWVNGGAWLTIDGQRVDLLYRSIEHLERVIADAEAGRYEQDYAQQPPFGFFSGTYLGELEVCVPLVDPEGRLEPLKRRVAVYPEALRRAVVRDQLWSAQFGLEAFAPKFARRGDAYGTLGCLTRVVNQLVLVLFTLNRRHPLNDKTVLAEIAEFEHAPSLFGPRVQETLSRAGRTPTELASAVVGIDALFRETVGLAEGLYAPRFRFDG